MGAARVSGRHANFVLTEGGARAADVLALLERVRQAVRAASGHELQLEVEVWGRDEATANLPPTAAHRPGDMPAPVSTAVSGHVQETSKSTARDT